MEFDASKIEQIDYARIAKISKSFFNNVEDREDVPVAIEKVVKEFNITVEELFVLTGFLSKPNKKTEVERVLTLLGVLIPTIYEQVREAIGGDFSEDMAKEVCVKATEILVNKEIGKSESYFIDKMNKAVRNEDYEEAERCKNKIKELHEK